MGRGPRHRRTGAPAARSRSRLPFPWGRARGTALRSLPRSRRGSQGGRREEEFGAILVTPAGSRPGADR